jgi:hypothetical protein
LMGVGERGEEEGGEDEEGVAAGRHLDCGLRIAD